MNDDTRSLIMGLVRDARIKQEKIYDTSVVQIGYESKELLSRRSLIDAIYHGRNHNRKYDTLVTNMESYESLIQELDLGLSENDNFNPTQVMGINIYTSEFVDGFIAFNLAEFARFTI